MPEDRSVLNRPGPGPASTVAYGDHSDQVLDAYLPADLASSPAIVFVHGGYWRPEYDRSHARSAAAGLAEAGYPTALIEYRRIPGDPDAMVSDVRTALAFVTEGRTPLPAGPVLLVGHSAGGHLALVATDAPHLKGCLALAPVADLVLADDLHLDDDAVGAFLGCPATGRPDLDPARLRSSACPVAVVHGEDDTVAPITLSESYASATSARLVRLARTGHFEIIDPSSAAWPTVIAELGSIARASGIE